MLPSWNNKVVAITGGSEGIGKALVGWMIGQGAKVATCGRNYDKLYDLQMQYAHLPLHTITCDVSIEQDCQRFIDSTIRSFGGIDILINNAGVSMRSLVTEVPTEVLRKLMDINFFGAVYCTKYALPSLLERKGVIVGVSSIAGYRGLPGRSGYSASKFALQGWLESLRTELLHSGVHVMWVAPGFTASHIRQAALDKEGKPQGFSPMDESAMMPAEEVAARIGKAIEKRKRTLVLTFSGKQAIFLNRFFPWLADRMTHRHFFKRGKLMK